MAQQAQGNDHLWEVHEDRLVRVETAVTDCRLSISVAASEIGYLRTAVISGFEDLSTKMGKSHAQHEDISNRLENLQPRLAKLEEGQREKDRRIRLVKSSGLAIVVAGLGAIAVKAAEKLWSLW